MISLSKLDEKVHMQFITVRSKISGGNIFIEMKKNISYKYKKRVGT